MKFRGSILQGHGEVQEGDDEFEAYRKRMMLGYKHRPNPLGAHLHRVPEDKTRPAMLGKLSGCKAYSCKVLVCHLQGILERRITDGCWLDHQALQHALSCC